MTPVRLYVYDLSNGIARSISRQLTGTQIDGIWHTSIVVFGKEISYGHGIDISHPGQTHHGRPLEICDLGETEIDEATFDEYISELRAHYTPEKYHLLDFNCNSFSNDVANFLTGRSIPDHIIDLPAHILATPFGQSLRPMIDNMYRHQAASGPYGYPTPSPTPPAGTGITPSLADSMLQSVAAQAVGAGPSSQAGPSPASPLHMSTNLASLRKILSRHRATVVLVSSGRTSMRNFEQFAQENAAKAGGLAAFVKVDVEVGTSKEITTTYGISTTPSLLCFRGDRQTSKVEDLTSASLRENIKEFIDTVFPRHPHTSVPLPSVKAISLDPILYTQAPSSIESPVGKLVESIDSAALKAPMLQAPSPNLDEAKSTVKSSFAPFLKRRFPPGKSNNPSVPFSQAYAVKWTQMTESLLEILPPSEIFPLIDLWRLAILDSNVSSTIGPTIVQAIETRFIPAISSEAPKPLLLTTLRLEANTFARPTFRSSASAVSILVAGLLHTDVSVRTAAASLAFNVSMRRAAPFVSSRLGAPYNWAEVERRAKIDAENEQDAELVCGLLEAIERENAEEVVHRLMASLALLLYFSPSLLPNDPFDEEGSDSELKSMLKILGAKEKVLGKLQLGGCGPSGVTKSEVRKLAQEVAILCP